MRRFIFLALIILLVLGIVGFASGVVIATTGPFLPGNPLFPVQYFAEQAHARLQGNGADQVETYFLLLERRIVNFVTQTGSAYEADSLDYLNKAIDQAILSWSSLPSDSADSLRERLLSLLSASEMAVLRLEVAPTDNQNLVAFLLAKLSTLRKLAEDPLANPKILARFVEGDIPPMIEEIAMQADVPDATIDPLAVPFPPGSLASLHAFYPLVGQHVQIECTDCHSEGVYDGTPAYCEACHAGVKPENHYVGDCEACHSAFAWSNVNFDHSLVNPSDCTSCHAVDKPANHYGNQCEACHSTVAWRPAGFNHQAAGATNCQSCHSDDKPSNHFSGQCSACHSSNSWGGASFNHSGQTDCQSCHSGDKPNNHFSGQCSACHSTNAWGGASFNHNGQTDCQSCHSGDKPNNHFSGQCSACHSTNSWKGASFNHNGQTDCQSCHSGDKPNNHFSGQCSACHSTNSWGGASFSHNGQTDCVSCHAGDRPGEHDSGQCSQCHNTDNWDADDDDGGDGGDGDDDSEDGKDDEHGSLDLASSELYASVQIPLECAACHTFGKVANSTVQSHIMPSWWQEFLMRLQNIASITNG